jgi:phosphoglycolate phosphatase
MVWKNRETFFHGVEKSALFFHSVENFFPHRGKHGSAAFAMTPQLFLFDLDGTLIDSRADLAAAVNRMRALHELPPLPLATVAAYVGDGVRTLALRALEGAPVDPDLAAREISAAYAAHLVDSTTAYPGVDAGLRALHAAGHALALVTNKPAAPARRLLDHFRWTPHFAVILGGGDTPELKPSPIPLLTAMDRTGHAVGDSWMVGDHHTDLEAARRASLRSIFLQSGFGHPGAETPDLVFSDFAAFVSTFLSRP